MVTRIKTRKTLTKLSGWLGRLPSLGYAFVYLLLIPLFATLYCLLPNNSFYHSTVQYEYSMSSETHNVRQALNNRIEENIKQSYSRTLLSMRGWSLNPTFVYVHSLTSRDDVISFRLSFVLKKTSSQQDLYFDPLVSFPSATRFTIKDADNTEPIDFKFVTIEDFGNYTVGSSSQEIIDALFPSNDPDLAGNIRYLRVSPQLSLQMQSMSRGLQGFPSGFSGNFVRMFYLSASTITTLGYGDITPITTTSRILVSMEAIIGIVMLGLFLNALSFERASRNPMVRE